MSLLGVFEDNLSSFECLGDHMRSILPRVTMARELPKEPREEWHVRDHANVLYTILPSSQFLVQQDHLVWITSEPIAADTTLLRLSTLVPTEGALADGKDQAHWKRNHAITTMTLDEDFDIGESIQSSLSAGANDTMLFGRYEGALKVFNKTIESYLADED